MTAQQVNGSRYKYGDLLIPAPKGELLKTVGLPVVEINFHENGVYYYRLDDPDTNTYWPEHDLIIPQPELPVKQDLTGVDAARWLEARGAKFCKVTQWDSKSTSPGKKPFEDGWQEKPYNLAQLTNHIKSGGNIGLICGKHSSGLCMFDADENTTAFLSKFHDLAEAPRIERDGADRGKVLVRVKGTPPGGKKFKRDGEKSPFFEWLSTGNQGVVPPSRHPSGVYYRLVNADHEIPELTPEEVSAICVRWTGKGVNITPAAEPPLPGNTRKPERQDHPNNDGLRDKVLSAWSIMDVFKHFGKVNAGTKKEGDWTRILGNGGLFIHKDGDGWSLTGEGEGCPGGGVFEAWWWCKHGNSDVPKDHRFYDLLSEMATLKGIEIPKRTNGNGHHPAEPIAPEYEDPAAGIDWDDLPPPPEPPEDDDYTLQGLPANEIRDPDTLIDLLAIAQAEERTPLLQELAKSLALGGVDTVELEEYAELVKEKGYIGKTAFVKATKDAQKDIAAKARRHRQTSPAGGQSPAWPYSVEDGRLSYSYLTQDGESMTSVIADFDAKIIQELIYESEERHFSISGQTAAGKPFTLEISAVDFADERKLKGALIQAAGAQASIRANMGKHLGPAIQILSDPSNITQIKRFDHTGWSKDHFLIPGREPQGVTIQLPRLLPYAIRGDGDLAAGLAALDSLIQSMGPEQTTIILTTIFLASLARKTDWLNERYGLFVSGRTGSLKTSTLQAALCLYGPGIMNDDALIKWGEGATRNAIMAMAAHAHDLPLLIDNYKPSTGDGEKGFVNLMHNIIEGGDKARLDRSAKLRDSKPIFCWPIVTGEDVPDKDAASLARMLVISMSWPKGRSNPMLQNAQENAVNLTAVGAAWLEWLESPDSQSTIDKVKSDFTSYRDQWKAYLDRIRPDSANNGRVASSLAVNKLAFGVVRVHPTIGPVFDRYAQAHRAGLLAIAKNMTNFTAQAGEARRFIDALRQLYTSGRAILLPRDMLAPINPLEVNRVIGWFDSEGIYLQPDLSRRAVLDLLGGNGLGNLSDRALYEQLNDLGMIKSRTQTEKETRWLKRVRIGESGASKPNWLLHLVPNAFDVGEDDSIMTPDARNQQGASNE